MKERPIMFSAPMVRALLDGRKTQTRRTVKNATGAFWDHAAYHPIVVVDRCGIIGWRDPEARIHTAGAPCPRCPYGKPGDRLYVKEQAWIWCHKIGDGFTKTSRPKFHYLPVRGDGCVVYCADQPKPNQPPAIMGDLPGDYGWRCKVGRFMPRWASRITLEITGVRVERVQEISEDDARAEGAEEGVSCSGLTLESGTRLAELGLSGLSRFRLGYAWLWESINDPGSWNANPWVWVIQFRKHSTHGNNQTDGI